MKLIRLFDALYRRIDEYNANYLSNFLFIFWLCFGTICVLIIYIGVFSDTNLFIRTLLIYGGIMGIILFNFVFSTACSLNLHAFKTYQLLHSLYLRYIRLYKNRPNIRLLMKV